MWRTPFCEGLARVYHLWVRGGGGADTNAPLVGVGEGGLARVYHLWVWGGLARVHHLLVWVGGGGAGTSVPLVCGDRTFTALPHCNSGDSFACFAFTMFWLRS